MNDEVFRDILNICPRVPGQEFDEPLTKEEAISFIRELGHSGEIKYITDVIVDHLHQPWRTFSSIINKCMCGKIDNKDTKKQDKITFMHTARDDSLLGTIRFISKHEDIQVYDDILPKAMKNQAMLDFVAYKTYCAIASGAEPLKSKKPKTKSNSAISSEGTPSKKKLTKTKKYVPSKKKLASKPNRLRRHQLRLIEAKVSFDYHVTLGFGSIAGGLDHVNPVIRLPLKHGISRVLGKVDHPNPSVGTNQVTASITIAGIIGQTKDIYSVGGGGETLKGGDADEEVSLVDGVLEGALGALDFGNRGSSGGHGGLWWLMMNEGDGKLVICIWREFMGRDLFENGMNLNKFRGVDNRRITLIVIRARANSAVVVSLMEFVLVVLMEMEIKSIFQLRTLLINLQFIYPEPDYSLDFNSPQDLHNLQQQNLCCENCRGPHATIECQPMSQNSHSFGFDQLQTPQFSVNHQPPQPMSMEALQAQEDLMKSIESFLKKFNRISFGKTPKVLLQAWDNFFEVKHAQSEEVQELLSKLVQDVKIISDELSEYINTPAWNRPLVYCDNDDDEDYTIAITPESPTKEPVNSLSLGDEHLDTIPATESDEFIKSSVENLVPTPIEFEDFSDDECDLPPYDDSSKNHDFTFSNPLFDIDEDFTLSDESFSEEDIPKENFIIFSNPLFDLDEEIASTKVDRINDEVLEGIHSIPPGIDSFDAESDLVESVLNRDISIDSSPKIDSLSNEFAGELILPKSIPPEIEEVEFDPEGDILFLESLLYDNSSPRPPEALQANSNAIESLPPSHIPVADNDSLMEEIDLFLADDGSIPPGIESDDVDSVDDDTSISLPEFESFILC
ncbi:hypothetical protein Tco_0891023 [Tanacetum coccineum]|uniref:Uncharacterized protein n=1 Tax=Tanacetum coccineum TaxID=301880 RepID=A0ABQ5C237_9ASTR